VQDPRISKGPAGLRRSDADVAIAVDGKAVNAESANLKLAVAVLLTSAFQNPTIYKPNIRTIISAALG